MNMIKQIPFCVKNIFSLFHLSEVKNRTDGLQSLYKIAASPMIMKEAIFTFPYIDCSIKNTII